MGTKGERPACFQTLERRLLLDAVLYGGTWRIRGDDGAAPVNDTIEIALSDADPALLEATINGVVAGTAPLARLRAIRLLGGDGNDTMHVSLPDDAGKLRAIRAFCGDGDDVLLVELPPDAEQVRVIARGQNGNDELHGGPGRDWLHGGTGDDVLFGEGGRDRLLGGRGADALWGGDGRDALVGGSGDDALHGGAESDRLFGQRGADRLDGGGGDDVLFGGWDGDVLDGGDGDDRLFGSYGDDVLSGGEGADRLYGSYGDDELDGGGGDDRLFAGPGADGLDGGEGNDRLYGSYGIDALSGAAGDDVLFGSAGADVLDGGEGNDRLYGGGGRDSIRPGLGEDLLSGGVGQDVLYDKAGDDVRGGRYDIRMGDPATAALEAFASEQAFRQRLVEIGLRQYDHLFGQIVPEWGWSDGPYYRIADGGDLLPTTLNFEALGGVTAGSPDVAETDADYSGTNNQVAGVEEADRVKTDGEYLYVLADGELLILDALPAEEIHVLSRTAIEGDPLGLFLFGDRLTVVSSSRWYWPVLLEPLPVDRVVAVPTWVGPEPVPYEPEVILSVYDLADRADPQLLEQTRLEGTVVDARAVDEHLFVVIGGDLYLPAPAYDLREIQPVAPNPDVPPADLGDLAVLHDGVELAYMPWRDDWRPTHERVYETADEYADRLMQIPLTDVLPTRSTDGGAPELLVDPAGTFLPPDSLSADLLTVARFDLSSDHPAAGITTTTIQGSGGHVYASSEGLYVAGRPEWTRPLAADDPSPPTTRIYKFDLTQEEMPLAATGIVAGTVHNQFSMDEYAGTFRVATTVRTWRTDTSNSLFVLEQVGDELVAAGALTDIARTEQIYSVRYVGEMAYMVTFRQIDPLFAIDLSVPTAPKVVGALHVPGFSRYLHPIDADTLIGLGRDADLAGRTRGLKLSLFDVSNPRRPREVDVELFGSAGPWGTSSEAEWDHHAFSYFDDYQTLCLPVYDYYADNPHSLCVLSVGGDGFEEIGSIAGDGRMVRSLRIGDNVYAVSSGSVTVADLLDPAHVIGTAPLK